MERLLTFHGIQNVKAVVAAQQKTGIPMSYALAMLENETGGGRNEFGGEGTACPAKWYEQEVTRFRYTVYKVKRNRGGTPNGVGPTQITDPALQIEAEHLGGCWKPQYNCEVGFRFLDNLIRDYGTSVGFERYNGSGPAAEAYANRASVKASVWHQRLLDAKLV